MTDTRVYAIFCDFFAFLGHLFSLDCLAEEGDEVGIIVPTCELFRAGADGEDGNRMGAVRTGRPTDMRLVIQDLDA